ncbi:putative WD40 associated region in TFIID subunit, NTD2 domain [Lyophyllum shimeji]|uniref:WD40 associated region in TFIID subunit, NTD2 domain n=1 Tax=Lyophyllum shimeji TaxID=47721 RepID=A0A9P3PHW8_LYOSH|nr:putative WD40 associated region in TFIID subunit, NTD2 domain [Lyophyllum shimeji]
MGNPSNIQNLIASIGSVGAEEILSLDPTDKQEGFRELEAWVDGSLDMYRPEFRPILFPIFCHFYLDLIQHGFKDAAQRFFSTFSPSLSPSHSATLHHISTLLLPRIRSGFGLLVGWLTEGIGGEAFGAGDGFTGERGKRGRAAVMRVVNNHLRFDVTSTNPTAVSPHAWEESTGLLTPLIPKGTGHAATTFTNPQAFNASKGDLKLGPAPISEELRTEAERTGGLAWDDIEREVSAVRDARKRIRLEPSVLANIDVNSPQASAATARALPSICCYTLHDVAEARIKDAASLQKIREKKGSTTRKLIGHSGPVYAVAFDPVGGSATPPKYLLSASSDATTPTLIVSSSIRTPYTSQQVQVTGQRGCGMSSEALVFESSSGTKELCQRSLSARRALFGKCRRRPCYQSVGYRVWKRIKKMTGHSASIYSIAFSAESSLLCRWTERKPRENGTMGLANGETPFQSYGEEDNLESIDLVATFPTKRTPITKVHFTPRNLCIVGGVYTSPELR